MLDRLRPDEVREALSLLGLTAPSGRPGAVRALRDAFARFGFVRQRLEQAPPLARSAFARLAHDGPATVEDLLGRGWWGRGLLPEPLDWLQRRGFVAVDDRGRVVAVAEARDGYLASTGAGMAPRRPGVVDDLAGDGGADAAAPVEPADAPAGGLAVEPASAVVISPDAGLLRRAVALDDTGLREIAPTVAVSRRPPAAVARALRAAGLPLADDLQVVASSDQPALPDRVEHAVGPSAIRALLDRAVAEGRQVRLDYYASSRGGVGTDRVVDPWTFADDLLRGWCHLRTAERTFALDRIGRARLLPSAVRHRPTDG